MSGHQIQDPTPESIRSLANDLEGVLVQLAMWQLRQPRWDTALEICGACGCLERTDRACQVCRARRAGRAA